MTTLQIAGGVLVAIVVGLVVAAKVVKGNEYEKWRNGR